MCIDANNLYGYAMSESLPYDEIKFDKNNNLEDIKKTPDGNDNGYFVEVDINYPDEIKEKTKYFPIAPEKKIILTISLHMWIKTDQLFIHILRS